MSDKQKKILLLGECMLELRAGQVRTLPLQSELAFAGDVFNVALYLARLLKSNHVVSFYTALGDDPFSQRMIDNWQQENIDCQYVKRLQHKLPGLYLIETDTKGERQFYYYRSESAARSMLLAETEQTLADVLAQYDYIYLSGITLAVLDHIQQELLLAVLKNRRKDQKFIFDLNYRPKLMPNLIAAQNIITKFLQQTDIALPTLNDYEDLFDKTGIESLQQDFNNLGISEVISKNGEDGCYYFSATDKEHLVVSADINVVDTTAAGDSFNAGYIASIMQGNNWQQ